MIFSNEKHMEDSYNFKVHNREITVYDFKHISVLPLLYQNYHKKVCFR